MRLLLLLAVCQAAAAQAPSPVPTPPPVPAPAPLPPPLLLLGPVTALVPLGERTACCSQRGIAVDSGLLPAPTRTFALAATGGASELLCGGGRPGVDGEVWLQHGAEVRGRRRLAKDVVTSVAAAAGRGAAGCADGSVFTFALAGDEAPVARQQHSGACRAVALAADGKLLASGGKDQLLLLHDLAAGTVHTCTEATAAIESLAFAADGQSLAAGCADGRVRLFARDGRLLRSWQRLGGAVLALAETPHGWCAGTDQGQLWWLRADREAAEPLQRLAAPVHALLLRGDRLLAGLHGGIATVPLPARPR